MNDQCRFLSPEIQTTLPLQWEYETDEFKGTCVIALDEMTIKFRFRCSGNTFFDVLKIDDEIDRILLQPVSVESAAEQMAMFMPGVEVSAFGRAESHGWISATAIQENRQALA